MGAAAMVHVFPSIWSDSLWSFLTETGFTVHRWCSVLVHIVQIFYVAKGRLLTKTSKLVDSNLKPDLICCWYSSLKPALQYWWVSFALYQSKTSVFMTQIFYVAKALFDQDIKTCWEQFYARFSWDEQQRIGSVAASRVTAAVVDHVVCSVRSKAPFSYDENR